MSLDRRSFLTMAAASGLGLLLPPRKARAAESSYGGPYWITLQAEGGWDPTCLCDPKGGTAGDRNSINQAYTPDQIGRAGDLSYAPVSFTLPTEKGPVEVYSAKRFFEAHGQKLLVINGIDTSTNNHETGRRVIWSGLPAEGYPSLGALIAAAAFDVRPVPMAFLSYGGYDVTANAVPLTRASNADQLWRVAYPNRIDPKRPDSPTFFTPATADRIAAAQNARTQRLLNEHPMPVMRSALQSLLAVRAGESGLSAISQYLPTTLIAANELPDLANVPNGKVNELQNLLRQAQLALAAFQAGVGVSASLVAGGFDTHGDHDNQHIPRLVQVLRAVDFIYAQAKALGLADRLYVLVASDFGRTPYYNQGNGKDHWAVTSMMMSGPGIVGGRVIGATDKAFQPMTFDPATLRPSKTGTRLQPAQIHHALRKLARIDSADVTARFPLPGSALPIVG